MGSSLKPENAKSGKGETRGFHGTRPSLTNGKEVITVLPLSQRHLRCTFGSGLAEFCQWAREVVGPFIGTKRKNEIDFWPTSLTYMGVLSFC